MTKRAVESQYVGKNVFQKEPVTDRIPRAKRLGGKYDKAIAEALCRRLMYMYTLREACEMSDMPTYKTVVKWLANPDLIEFHEQFHRAQQVQAYLRMDEIYAIADDASKDYEIRHDKNGTPYIAFCPEHVNRSKLRVETRIKIAEKLLPKIFGNRKFLDVEMPEDLRHLLADAMNRDKGLPPKPTHTFDAEGEPIE